VCVLVLLTTYLPRLDVSRRHDNEARHRRGRQRTARTFPSSLTAISGWSSRAVGSLSTPLFTARLKTCLDPLASSASNKHYKDQTISSSSLLSLSFPLSPTFLLFLRLGPRCGKRCKLPSMQYMQLSLNQLCFWCILSFSEVHANSKTHKPHACLLLMNDA